MTQKETVEDNVLAHYMVWPERIIWIIGIATFFVLCIYQSLENEKHKKDLYNKSWEIRDLKFDKIMLQNDVKFYKDMDSISKAFELNLLHKLNTLK